MNYKNKTALVTGAANGIGKAIAQSLYNKGCNVVFCDIQRNVLQEIYSQYDANRVLILQLNVCQPKDWEFVCHQTKTKFGSIDFLLNIAGVIEPGFIYKTPIEMIDRQIDINLKGTIYGVQVVSKEMVKQKSGHIVNISSMAGLAPVSGLTIYSATKFGIRGFSLSIAQELYAFGINVSVICPDAVKTNMLDYQSDKKEAAMTFSAGKYLTVEDLTQSIISVLEKPKFEVWLPKSRGILATIGALFPGLALKLTKKLQQKGLKKQDKYKI
jgi:3-oxoacyl-[acyl-carrier protein] reductase